MTFNKLAIPGELRALPNWVDAINNYFRYDPDTGYVYNLYTGKQVGFLNGFYLRASLHKKQFYIHQIAFAIMVKFIPIEIDHIDKDKLNNKWLNLREANRSNNAANVFMRVNNKSGLKGVSWSKGSNCWRMDIQYNNIKYYSLHKTEDEAYRAYCLKSAELHKEFGCVY